MSPFDLSFMSVPPEGGTEVLAAGVPTSPKDEAPSDVFAQLLAQLSSMPEEDVTLTPSEVGIEESELATEALSTSPDGWEDTRLDPGVAPAPDDDEPTTSPVLLTGFVMPLPGPQEALRSPNGNQSIEDANAVEDLPAARNVSEGLTEVLAQNGPDATSLESVQPADAAALESLPRVATGKTPTALSQDVSSSNPTVFQFEGSVTQVQDQAPQLAASAQNAATDKAQASTPEAASRGGRSEAPAPAAAARDRNSVEDSTRLAHASTAPVAEMAGSLERRANSQGESQPELTPKGASVPSGSVGQPQQVVQSFHQAVAAAIHAAAASATPTAPPSDPGGLDNQIVQGIRRLWRDGSEEIRVTLRPEYLGALTISLKVDQNAVSAVLHVDEPQVRAWVQAHEAQLRQAMTSQGLSLEQLVVTDEQPGKDNRGRDAETRQNRRPNPNRTSDEPAPVFEVAV